MRKRIWLTLTLAALTAIGAYALWQQEGLPVGSDAPNFKLTTLDGQTVELEKLRGKPVFIDFWATWCGPCRRALPHTQKLAEKYGKDAHILAINLREDEETVRAFLQRHNYNFIVPMDKDGAVASAYRVRGIPHFVLIDARGKVQFVQVGYGPGMEQKFEQELQKAIRTTLTRR
ncbi:MAG: TlpA family protein disulfide reductase [Fimbriimonadales bacterium]|nr:TlpA family protein disulfide reductase [Fimbriimonadales bacterium]